MAAINPLLFYTLSAVLLTAAVAVVRARNIFHAALSLGVVFFAVAGLYVTLNAEFLAGMQILVYVGAIIVLILFAIMLTQGVHKREVPFVASHQAISFLAVLLFGLVAGLIIAFHPWILPLRGSHPPMPHGEAVTGALGQALLCDYALPFELVSVLMLAGLLGALALAKEER